MATTWAGTAMNQLVTLKAMRNACSLGYYGYSSLPTDSLEIMTVGDLNTFGITYNLNSGTATLYSTFTGISNGKCVTKYDLVCMNYFDISQNNTCNNSLHGLAFDRYYVPKFQNFGSVASQQVYANRACTIEVLFGSARYIQPFNSFGELTTGINFSITTAGKIIASCTP